MSNVNTIIGTSTLLEHHGPTTGVATDHPHDDMYVVAAEDVALHEDQILDDPIVTSEDEHAPDKIALAVALVQSVVETSTSKREPAVDSKKGKSKKRRRPSRKDGKTVDDSMTSTCDSLPPQPNESQLMAPPPPAPPVAVHHSAPPPVTTSISSVPSPLDATIPPAPTHHDPDPPTIHLPENSTVPNPLSNPLPPAPASTSANGKTDAGGRHVTFSGSTSTAFPVTVPCPLPVSSFEDREHETSGVKADGVTSAPLEPSPKEMVTVTETNEGASTQRVRAFSIDLDPSFLDSMVITQDSASHPGELMLGSGSSTGTGARDRAFSFECFAFGINADEPLPSVHDQPQEVISSAPLTRPRGDSIIFDPVSFQDGGIHEKTATLLAGPRSRGLSVDLDEAALAVVSASDTVDHKDHNKVPPLTSSSAVPNPTATVVTTVPATVSVTHRQPTVKAAPPPPIKEEIVTNATLSMTTLPSSLSATMTTTTATGATTTFSMELLNKDGRIGIYLPEARKARIARFHAKRKMRIWRKRIKYDCRKKLADSRPRIKGRFVKRSDMGEE